MIWWMVLIWLVVVGAPMVYVGIKAVRTAKRANALQTQIQAIMAEIQTDKLVLLAARQEELKQNLARLTAAMDRLRFSLDTLRELIDRSKAAIAPLRFLLKLLRA